MQKRDFLTEFSTFPILLLKRAEKCKGRNSAKNWLKTTLALFSKAKHWRVCFSFFFSQKLFLVFRTIIVKTSHVSSK